MSAAPPSEEGFDCKFVLVVSQVRERRVKDRMSWERRSYEGLMKRGPQDSGFSSPKRAAEAVIDNI